MTKTQQLGIEYAVKVLLLLIKSVQKIEGHVFLDILRMVSDLLQDVPALAIAESKVFPREAVEVMAFTVV